MWCAGTGIIVSSAPLTLTFVCGCPVSQKNKNVNVLHYRRSRSITVCSPRTFMLYICSTDSRCIFQIPTFVAEVKGRRQNFFQVCIYCYCLYFPSHSGICKSIELRYWSNKRSPFFVLMFLMFAFATNGEQLTNKRMQIVFVRVRACVCGFLTILRRSVLWYSHLHIGEIERSFLPVRRVWV